MKQEFNNLVEALKTDNKLLISVFNANTFEKIIPAKTGENIILEYGSIENFFENIFQKNHRKISVSKYKKNGTGLLKIGNLQFDFSEKETTNIQPMIETTPIPAIPMNNAGMNGMVGLSFPELLNYGIKANESDVLKIENKYLKEQNENFKLQIEELKEERLASKYDSENKKNNSTMLLGMAETFAPLLMNVLGKANIPSPSLNAPVNDNIANLSDVKKQMIAFVNEETTYDVHLQFLFQIIEKVNSDAGFYDKVLMLINEVNE